MNVSELHKAAMDRAELALLARMRKEYTESARLFRESLDLELQAIEALSTTPVEPTFSILHRSAATLAIDCNEPRIAEKLIAKALANDPPNEIIEELRDLWEQARFKRHLRLRGVTLDDDEMQISMAGEGVGFGVVHSNEFTQRVDFASKVIYRLAEKRQNKPFRERGRITKRLKDDYEVFLSVPRAASFAVTLKIGRPSDQLQLPGMDDVQPLVDEFMDLMDLFDKDQYEEIEKRIPDPAYRTNFVQLAKRLAPDGENVKLVGFTSTRRGEERTVAITKPKTGKTLSVNVSEAIHIEDLPERLTISGVLLLADATHEEKTIIGIVDDKTHRTLPVKVPIGMMDDIVRPLWKCHVVIKGTRAGQYIMLEDIEEK